MHILYNLADYSHPARNDTYVSASFPHQ